MNAKYIFLFAAISIFLAQSVSSVPKSSDRGIIDDLFEKIKQLIKNVTDEVSQEFDKAMNAAKDLQEKASKLGDAVLEEFTKSLNELLEKAHSKVQEAIEQAEKLKVDVKVCVSGQEDNIKKLIDQIILSATACVQSEVDTALKMITDDMAVCSEQMEFIKTLPGQLTDCMDLGCTALVCLKDLMSKVIETEKTLPAKIIEMVNEAVDFVNGLQVRLEVCETRGLLDASVKIAEFSAAIIQCIEEKISEAEPTKILT